MLITSVYRGVVETLVFSTSVDVVRRPAAAPRGLERVETMAAFSVFDTEPRLDPVYEANDKAGVEVAAFRHSIDVRSVKCLRRVP